MNHVTLSGNLTRDPEVRYLDGGSAVTNFTIANNRKGKDGKEYVTFARCVAWGEIGVRLADNARKGSRLVIEGELISNKWTDKNDRKHEDLEISVRWADVVMKYTAPTTALPNQVVESDLPF